MAREREREREREKRSEQVERVWGRIIEIAVRSCIEADLYDEDDVEEDELNRRRHCESQQAASQQHTTRDKLF